MLKRLNKYIAAMSPLFIFSVLSAQLQVSYSIDLLTDSTPISPYIYGTNKDFDPAVNWTAFRQGGNRLTGYNWENNASNAGKDWHHVSDNYLAGIAGISDSSAPGKVTTTFLDDALEKNAYSIVTLQMAGYAARDKKGPVSAEQSAPSERWAEVVFTKSETFSLKPDQDDNYVYMDEYVNFLINRYGLANTGKGVKAYSLDNEPALWSETHPRIHPDKVLCSELIKRSIALSKAVKNVDSHAEIYGPALYGFNAFLSLQDAPDWLAEKNSAGYDWFIDYYLDKMKMAENEAGFRLLDVLDLHWYSEARGDNRITENFAGTHKDALARVQAPRTLWDPDYQENSWICENYKSYLPLIPRVQASINKYYPGTRIAFAEINYGGGNHISGAIAIADMLGIMAKYQVYLAALWPLSDQNAFHSAAYKMYRNYDGKNSAFGDLYVSYSSGDIENSSLYVSCMTGQTQLNLVVINKSFDQFINGSFSLNAADTIVSGEVWRLDSLSSAISKVDPVKDIDGNTFRYKIPAASVCHIILKLKSGSGVIKTRKEKSFGGAKLENRLNQFNPFFKIIFSSNDQG
ncbi:MAG: glycoside hydrolase family 44 protein [Calditrichaceae bacterium]|nr:glycoside hydrolase family 44 protein [Calditrichaceae bacterium]